MLAIRYGDGHFCVNICPAIYIEPWNPRTQLTLVNMPKALLGFAVLCSDRSLNIQQEWGSRSWWSPDMSRAWGTARGHIERFWNVFPFNKIQLKIFRIQFRWLLSSVRLFYYIAVINYRTFCNFNLPKFKL